MGCCSSKEKRASAYIDFTDIKAAEDDAPAPANIKNIAAGKPVQQQAAADAPKKLDKKDFRFVACKDETKVKPPGAINGQSFQIDKCENCDIYILDWCAQVTIDECKGCRIFIGPTDGAVFIRDCSGCSFAVVCRQLRTRGCNDCKVAVHCRTKPIVETSINMGFACLDWRYPQLKEHMQAAKLGPFHNFWWDIFDFTPKEGNFQLLPPGVTTQSLLAPQPAEVAELVAAPPPEEGAAEQVAPTLATFGWRKPRPEGPSYLFVAFPGAMAQQALSFAASAGEKGWLLTTNEVRMSAEVAAALAAEAGWAKAAGKALATEPGAKAGTVGCVGMELAVPAGEAEALQAQAAQLGGHCSDSELPGKTFRTMGLSG